MSRWTTILSPLFVILVCAWTAAASDIYFAQTAAGSNNGTSCANAYAYNDSAHGWSVSSSQVAGNRLHVCSGTWTFGSGAVILTTSNAGTSSNPIQLIADQGSVTLQAPYFNAGGAIQITQANWVINGGSYSNMTIQNTSNGTPGGGCVVGACSKQQASQFINFNGASNVTVENLTVANNYVLTPGASDGWCFNNCQPSNTSIEYINSNNILIDHVLCHDSWNCFNGWGNNVTISYTTAYNVAAASWYIAAGNVSGFQVHDNWWYGTGTWWTAGDDFHLENGHFETDGGSATGMMIYNNKFGPENNNHYGAGAQTSHIYISGNVSGLRFFNNLCANSPTDFMPCFEATNGMPAATIVNNTFFSGAAQAGSEGYSFDDGSITNLVFKNNVVVHGNGLVAQNGSFASGGLNNNAYDSQTPQQFGYDGANKTALSQWQNATGQDARAIYQSFSSLMVNADGTLQSGSPIIGLGANLGSLGIAALQSGAPQDFGVEGGCGSGCIARGSGAWDGGAFPYSSSGGNPPNPPSNVVAVVH